MALEDLIQALRREADEEVAAILAAARTEVNAIHGQSEADLAARRGALQAKQDAERRSAVELALAVARRDARREVLEARARLLDRVFSAARTRFTGALVVAEYRAALPAQLADALGCLGDRPGTVRCHPDLLQELRRLVGNRTGIRVLPDPAVGSGFKVASEDGGVVIDGTLEDRLARLETRIKQEVLAQLETRP
jgi:vacuolar-type H+-ATPase subunit E/Vma4